MDNSLAAYFFGIATAVFLTWIISEETVEVKERIEPEIKVVQKGAKSDTTYVYHFEKK